MAMILKEYTDFQAANATLLTESDPIDPTKKNLCLAGIFMQANIKNHNGRIYPLTEISKAVQTLSEGVAKKQYPLGELSHPEELEVNLDRVTHLITEIRLDGNNAVGKLKIIPTPMGNVARTLLESGVQLGVSSRGSGNVNDQGLVEGFEVVTIDLVYRPSAPSAYPSLVYEAMRGKKGKIISDLARTVQFDPGAQKYLKKELLSWINQL